MTEAIFMKNYPRDLLGYADHSPDPQWSGGARIAVNFVLNYEEGGERSVLHGDETSEIRLTDLAATQPIRNGRDLNMESAYEYGARVGVWRLLKIMADRQVPFTVYAVGMAFERNPRVAEAMAAAGCDFVDHGWRWIGYHTIDEETEREHIRRSVEIISRLTGRRPLGWYVGTPSPATRRLVVEEGGFLYDSDAYNDELPYWNHDYGRPHLIIPHTLDDNDTRLARGLGWGQAGDFYTSLKDNFDALYAAGEEAPRMMTVAVHCRLAGKPGRAAAFAKFIDYVLAHDRVWICHRLDIARHWRDHHPPVEGDRHEPQRAKRTGHSQRGGHRRHRQTGISCRCYDRRRSHHRCRQLVAACGCNRNRCAGNGGGAGIYRRPYPR
jgi:putative urate catabolism protein